MLRSDCSDVRIVALVEHDQHLAAERPARQSSVDHRLGARRVEAEAIDHLQRVLRAPCRRARSAARPGASSAACACAYDRAAGGRRPRRLRNCGARVLPWRARPVPFWRYGFLPSAGHLAARLGVCAVPWRWLAGCARPPGGPAMSFSGASKTRSLRSSVETTPPAVLYTLTCGMPARPFLSASSRHALGSRLTVVTLRRAS